MEEKILDELKELFPSYEDLPDVINDFLEDFKNSEETLHYVHTTGLEYYPPGDSRGLPEEGGKIRITRKKGGKEFKSIEFTESIKVSYQIKSIFERHIKNRFLNAKDADGKILKLSYTL